MDSFFFAPVLQNKPCISAQPPPTTVTFAIAYVYIIMTNNCLEICQFKIEDSSVIAKKLLYMIYILNPPLLQDKKYHRRIWVE